MNDRLLHPRHSVAVTHHPKDHIKMERRRSIEHNEVKEVEENDPNNDFYDAFLKNLKKDDKSKSSHKNLKYSTAESIKGKNNNNRISPIPIPINGNKNQSTQGLNMKHVNGKFSNVNKLSLQNNKNDISANNIDKHDDLLAHPSKIQEEEKKATKKESKKDIHIDSLPLANHNDDVIKKNSNIKEDKNKKKKHINIFSQPPHQNNNIEIIPSVLPNSNIKKKRKFWLCCIPLTSQA